MYNILQYIVTNVRKWCLVRVIRTILYLHTYDPYIVLSSNSLQFKLMIIVHCAQSFALDSSNDTVSNVLLLGAAQEYPRFERKKIENQHKFTYPSARDLPRIDEFSWRKIQHQAEEPFCSFKFFFYSTTVLVIVHIPC